MKYEPIAFVHKAAMTSIVTRWRHVDRKAILISLVCRLSVRILNRVYDQYYCKFNVKPNSPTLEKLL